MPVTTKVLRKLAAQVQSGSSYESSAMFLLPLLSQGVKQTFDPIKDESIFGAGYGRLPLQGIRRVGGDVSVNVDAVSIETLLTAICGADTAGRFVLGNHDKKLSMALLDAVNCVKLANVYASNLSFSASENELLKATVSLFGVTAVNRDTTSTFPAVTGYGSPFSFHELTVRVGALGSALGSGNEIRVKDFNIELPASFTEQFNNVGLGSLTPVWGSSLIEPKCSFTLPRHEADTFLAWRDAHTPLQADFYFYKSATSSIRFSIPYFVISADVTDDDIAGIAVEAMIGANGISTPINTDMNFVNPIAIDLVNS